MTTQQQDKSAIVLANAIELTAEVIKNIAGNDIASALNNSPLTKSSLITIAANRIHSKINSKKSK